MMRGGSLLWQPRTSVFTKADVTAGTAWTTGNSPITVFTVTGNVMLNVFGVVTTPLTSTSSTGTIALGTASGTGTIIAATTVNGTKLHTTGFVWCDTTASSNIAAMSGTTAWYACSGNLIVTIATNSLTAGGIILYCNWVPMSAGSSVK